MTKEEIEDKLEKATGQELIEERDYCGVDGYYGNYLESVNAEMLKRFNRLAEFEEENRQLEKEKCELLGIIQGKDKAIADLKTTILKLRNCMNCKYRDTSCHSSCKDKGIVLCSHWEMKE